MNQNKYFAQAIKEMRALCRVYDITRTMDKVQGALYQLQYMKALMPRLEKHYHKLHLLGLIDEKGALLVRIEKAKPTNRKGKA